MSPVRIGGGTAGGTAKTDRFALGKQGGTAVFSFTAVTGAEGPLAAGAEGGPAGRPRR